MWHHHTVGIEKKFMKMKIYFKTNNETIYEHTINYKINNPKSVFTVLIILNSSLSILYLILREFNRMVCPGISDFIFHLIFSFFFSKRVVKSKFNPHLTTPLKKKTNIIWLWDDLKCLRRHFRITKCSITFISMTNINQYNVCVYDCIITHSIM